jgi:hypothetical protein
MAECETDEYGTKFWYNNSGRRHRTDGPAIVYTDGCMMWFVHGERHRTDGPAVIWGDGQINWHLDGNACTFGTWLVKNTYISDEEKVMMALIWA